jgi:hypothetical protein
VEAAVVGTAVVVADMVEASAAEALAEVDFAAAAPASQAEVLEGADLAVDIAEVMAVMVVATAMAVMADTATTTATPMGQLSWAL